MKRFTGSTLLWKILFFVGLCPILAPFAAYLYEMLIKSGFTLGDWLILWSFLYWWTYVIGVGVMILAAVQIKRRKK